MALPAKLFQILLEIVCPYKEIVFVTEVVFYSERYTRIKTPSHSYVRGLLAYVFSVVAAVMVMMCCFSQVRLELSSQCVSSMGLPGVVFSGAGHLKKVAWLKISTHDSPSPAKIQNMKKWELHFLDHARRAIPTKGQLREGTVILAFVQWVSIRDASWIEYPMVSSFFQWVWSRYP
jgi:hypothetical protein